MNQFESVRMGLRAIRDHPRRSGLAALGVAASTGTALTLVGVAAGFDTTLGVHWLGAGSPADVPLARVWGVPGGVLAAMVAVLGAGVGAVAIAAVMLVAAVERAPEIAVMRAAGAQPADIAHLFVVEAALCGGLGGVGGVVGGALATAAVTASAGVPTVVLVEWGSGAVAAGALLGAVAGLYPAWRAARTDPATAFRAT